MKLLFYVAAIGLFCSFSILSISPEEILRRAEQKLTSSTITSELEITIERPKWTKEMVLKTWGKGSEYAMAYVLSPAKDAGTVYMKSKNEVYNYLPKIKRTVKLPAALMSQNWMGTDLSTDDLVRLSQLTKDYNPVLKSSVTVNGRDCYVIDLMPLPEADVIWGKLRVMIDKKDYIQMKTIFYDEDMEAVNVLISSEIKNLGGKMLATTVVMKPVNKSGFSTTVHYKNITFNKPISSFFFTKENMPKVRP